MDIPPPPPPPSPLVLQLVPDEAIKIEKLFLELNENNLEIISHKVSKVLEVQPKCSLLYEFYITQCIYMSYSTQNKDASLYILFLNLLSNTKNLSFSKLLNVLTIYLYQIKTNESECLLNEMNKQKMIPSNLFYYVKRIVNKENQENQKENHILEILRNDNIEELQEMSAQNKFDFNQTIEPSPSEKSSFVNHKNVSLIDYAAFFKSIKCFKFLLINGSNVENTLKYAIAGGNLEIIHLCIQNNSTISNVLETAIQFHRNDVFYYFYDERNQRFVERKYFIIDKDLNKLGIQCLKYINYEILSFLAKEGLSKLSLSLQAAVISFNNLPFIHLFFEGKLIKNELFFDLLNNGNPIVVKWLIKQKGIKIENEDYEEKTFFWASKNNHVQLFKHFLKHGIDINAKDEDGDTALIFASENGEIEIVKLLLEQEGLNINAKDDIYFNNFLFQNNISRSCVIFQTALMKASISGNLEVVKLLLEQEGIDINAKDRICFDNLIFQNNIWKLFKLFKTALILASQNGHTEIAKLLLEQKGIKISAQDIFILNSL